MPSITKERFAALEAFETAMRATGAQAVACLTALECAVAQQAEDIARLEQQLDEAKSEARSAIEHSLDVNAIRDRGALMRKAKALSAQGVPCTLRGDYIRHTKTGAILAQVQR